MGSAGYWWCSYLENGARQEVARLNEILITIMLLIPAPHKGIDWTINEVPTQIQIIHKSGLEVSYSATPVSCNFIPRPKREILFRSSRNHCYVVSDLNSPRFVRHPSYWYSVKSKLEN